MEDNIKLGNREGLEALKTSPNSNMPQKTTKTITSIHEKENRRRERDFLVSGNNNIVISQQLIGEFKDYLIKQKQSPHTIRNKIQYVKRFSYILKQGNAQDLLSVSAETRQHAMKSLASLSKYMGIYDRWHDIIRKYQLKWPKKEGFSVFNEIFNNSKECYSSMLEWIKTSIQRLPKSFGNVILFNTLTGLRPDEGYKAMNLIKINSSNYVDEKRMLLMHYKFPDIFLRVSKKAYVSIVNEDILKAAANGELITNYRFLRNKFMEFSVPMNMYYCRKVFATYLRNNGIESEIIDLLQGWTPSSIFVNHYYRPDMNEIISKRIRPVLLSLNKMLVDIK